MFAGNAECEAPRQWVQFQADAVDSKKNRDAVKFAACKAELAALKDWARQGGCQLLDYDEAGFSASPPVQRAWSPVGQPHPVTPAHHQRVSMMGALDFADQRLHHQQVTGTIHRETFVAFIERLLPIVTQPTPTFIVLDNARIHHGLDDDTLLRWINEHNTFLCYLPPYSPELNMIEILWKHAKYHWRAFVTWTKDSLHEKVRELLNAYGTKFQINFTWLLNRSLNFPLTPPAIEL